MGRTACALQTARLDAPTRLGNPAVNQNPNQTVLEGKRAPNETPENTLRRAEKRFNVVGPNHIELHYTVPGETRLPQVANLCRHGEHVIVKAPRLSGKTTWARAFVRQMRSEQRFIVLGASLYSLQRREIPRGELPQEIIKIILQTAEKELPPILRPRPLPQGYDARFASPFLIAWARACPLPIILVLDDLDDLPEPHLRELLPDLRACHASRANAAPLSLVITTAADLETSLDVAISVELKGFSADEIQALTAQYTAETGQAFLESARARLFEISGGHPWVINAIAREITERLRPNRRAPITEAHVFEAQRRLLQSTH